MNMKEMREAAEAALRELNEKAAGRDFTTEEAEEISAHAATIENAKKIEAAAKASDELLAGIGKTESDAEVKSVGESYVKSDGFSLVKAGQYGARTAVKANTDIHGLGELGTAYDSTRDLGVAPSVGRDDLTIFNWLRPVEIEEAAVKWVEETADEGNFKIVKPGDQKPQLHFGYTAKSAALATAAGWFDSHVSLIRRAPEFAARINERGLRRLRLDQENLLLNGKEATDGFNGLLNTSGIGTVTAANKAEWLDALYDAITQAETLGEYPVDGIVISRADWGVLRKTKDAQGAYLMGNPFAPGLASQTLFEVPVYVSSQLAAGTAVVGSSENATMYLDKQIYVDVTNSDKDKFTKNIVTTRIEQDMLPVFERPGAFVKVTLTGEQ